MNTTATHRLHSVTRERVRAITTAAAAQAYADDPTLRAATYSTRPVCLACGSRGLPTIDGYCAADLAYHPSLSVLSPTDLGIPGK